MNMKDLSQLAITDPHCHFWDLSLGYNGWISDRESDLLGPLNPLNKNYLPTDYLADTAGYSIQKFIHIEAASTRFAKNEVEWLIELSKKTDKLAGIVAGADLLDVQVEQLLKYYSSISLIKGIRQILNWHNNSKYTAADRHDNLVNPLWHKHFSLLEKYRLSFDMQICPTQMKQAYALAKKYHQVLIIIDHAGMPIEEDLPIWKQGIKELSQCENVMIKLSGFGMLNHDWTQQSIEAYIHYVLEHFGMDRCMFAGNFPVDKLYHDFSTIIETYYSIVESASLDEKQKLFSKNAERIYRLS